MSITARPRNNLEERLDDMLVAFLEEQIPVRGVTANIRSSRDTTKARNMPAFIVDIQLIEPKLIRLQQYACVIRIHSQTRADGSSEYDGDPDMSDCKKMLGVLRDAFYRTTTVSDLNRLANGGLIVHEDGWRETNPALDESEGSVNDLAMEIEINCYIP